MWMSLQDTNDIEILVSSLGPNIITLRKIAVNYISSYIHICQQFFPQNRKLLPASDSFSSTGQRTHTENMIARPGKSEDKSGLSRIF